MTLATAQQTDAPVLWPLGESFAAAWVGADSAGVHQDARQYAGDLLGAVVVLPLVPDHPFAQTAALAGSGNLHLLWMDSGDDNTNRLFSALLSPDLTVLRGATRLSTGQTMQYAVAPAENGGLWVVWSGGSWAEPSLYAQYLDGESRPREAALMARSGEWPALARTDEGEVFAFWLDHTSGDLRRTRLIDGEAVETTRLTSGVHLETGDRLIGLSAAFDTSYAYVFWNITRADGTDETWMAAGSGTAIWNAPARLTDGDTPLAWAAPLAGQHASLPVAVERGGEIGLTHLENGAITDYEPVASLSSELVGLPGLYASADGGLYVTWSEPTPLAQADLKVAIRTARSSPPLVFFTHHSSLVTHHCFWLENSHLENRLTKKGTHQNLLYNRLRVRKQKF